VDARLGSAADVILVAEAPVVPKISSVDRLHTPFADDAGQIVIKAIESIKKEAASLSNLKVHRTYAVLCTSNQGDKEPAKAILDRCKGFLHGSLAKCTSLAGKTPTIIAMGMTAVKALGIKAGSLKEVQSRVLSGVQIGDQLYNVVVTISTKQLVAMAGMYNTFYNDLRRAMQIAAEGAPELVPMEELTKGYVFPKTIAEVRELCEHILSYSEDGKPPEKWSISVDTETNTKFPHRDKLKVLCVSFAWATGKAAAIPLWHDETPYDPNDAIPYIRALLESSKPKIFQNGKFDLKVFKKIGLPVENFAWDSMLAEHALEEDKKGQYGLKEMTRVNFPEFAGYADVLHAMLEKEEGDSQLENIRKSKKTAAADDFEALSDKPKKKKLTKKEKKQQDGGFEKIPLATLLPYAAIDTDMTRRISIRQMQRMVVEENVIRQLKNIESRDKRRRYPIPDLCKLPNPVKSVAQAAIPRSRVLSNMEFRGIRVDRPYLEKLQTDLGTVVSDAEEKLYKMAQKPDLKLNHAASIANILFSEGFIHPTTGQRTFYPPVSFTQKGQIQTTEKVMKFLTARYECPFSATKLIYSKAYKAKNTFCQNVWDLSSIDGFLHTNYNVHGTSTGRLSSNDENMQNIPKKLASTNIKKIFIPSDDSMVFVNADAKAAEVRIFAAYSRDSELIQSLNDGLDTHAFFAAKIVEAVRLEDGSYEALDSMGLDGDRPLTYEDFLNRDGIKQIDPVYGEMLDKFRTAVKRVVFGVLYGAQSKKIAETIGISQSQAQSIIDMLFRLFPSIPRYIEQTHWELSTFGYVETYFGRRRRFNVKGASGYLRSRAERQTVNFKIQSTSSDIVLDTLVELEGPLERDMRGRLLLTVHDSIGFEIPKRYLSQLPDFVNYYLEKRASEKYPWLPVAFKWDFELGDSYGELKPYDAYIQNKTIQEIINEAAEAYTEEEVRTELADVEDAA